MFVIIVGAAMMMMISAQKICQQPLQGVTCDEGQGSLYECGQKCYALLPSHPRGICVEDPNKLEHYQCVCLVPCWYHHGMLRAFI